jgi:hypothetical protein
MCRTTDAADGSVQQDRRHAIAAGGSRNWVTLSPGGAVIERVLTFLVALALAAACAAQEAPAKRIRYDTERATVYFDAGLSAAEMERFVGLLDRGIANVESFLNGGRPARPADRITFHVARDETMSRTFRRTVVLPMERVRTDSAPYLHETAHILLPTHSRCLWLSEGFASYVQSYVSEHLGGYDGYVFSWGGNGNVDRLARRYLATESGQAVLPYVGGEGAPPGIQRDRRRVAAPFYVLSHSFLKFLVERQGIEKVKGLVEASDVGRAIETTTGRTAEEWKADWLTSLDDRTQP